jgi:ribosomal protein S13
MVISTALSTISGVGSQTAATVIVQKSPATHRIST